MERFFILNFIFYDGSSPSNKGVVCNSTLPEAVKSVLILDTTLPLLKNGKANLNGLSQKTCYKIFIFLRGQRKDRLKPNFFKTRLEGKEHVVRISFLLLLLIFSFTLEGVASDSNSFSPEETNEKIFDIEESYREPKTNTSTSKMTFSNPKISNSDILFTQFGGSATVITEYDIEKSGASDVQELLRKIPGLSIKQSGGRGGVASIFSRGSESDHNLVIINGVKVNEIGGYYDFSRLSVNNIEQIEVLRGAASCSLWARCDGFRDKH